MTETSFGTELKSKLLSGVKKLNDSVSSTLGPAGRTVLIKGEYGQLTVTKDGVTVAKAFKELEDPIESTGAELVQKVSVKSANEVGDGTTTSTLLTYAILEEGLKHVNAGQNPVEIKKGIDAAVNELKTALNNLTEDISDNQQIKEVATISGNNDEEIGNLIATALEKVGRDGVVAIEESKSGETSLEITVPPVNTAISSSAKVRRSLKSGALTAHTLTIPRILLTIVKANASPSISSATINNDLVSEFAIVKAFTNSFTLPILPL